MLRMICLFIIRSRLQSPLISTKSKGVSFQVNQAGEPIKRATPLSIAASAPIYLEESFTRLSSSSTSAPSILNSLGRGLPDHSLFTHLPATQHAVSLSPSIL